MSLAKRLWYDFLHPICRVMAVALLRVRADGREHLPSQGGALLLSNHQSHFDPVLVGLSTDRRLGYLARETLFRWLPFRWLIQSLNAIPIDRDGMGLGGLKETLRRLKRGEVVLLFPEGTRTRDGRVGHVKSGFCALARRAGVPLVPAALDGAFDAWPRHRPLPGLATVHVRFGPPILPADIERLNDDELVAEIERRICACHDQTRQSRLRAAK